MIAIGRNIYLKNTSKTPAALDGRLKPGDRILEVGEQSLDNATCDQATKLLMDSPALLQLTVYRRPSDLKNGH